MANIYSLQLLRNGQIFTSYADAKNAILTSTTQDGVIKLARYTDSTAASGDSKYQTSTVKTIFGIYADFAGGTGWTIYDSYYEIIKNLQDQIDTMTGGAGSIAQQIEAALDQLDFSGVTGNVVTGVEQTNGKVTATGANVGTLALTGYEEGTASGHVEATDSINDAFAKLQNQIDAANDAKDAAIAGLDYTDAAVAGEYVSQVTETDGVIAVTRVELPSAGPFAEAGKPIVAVSETKGAVSAATGTINAEFVNVADAGNNFSSTTVEATLAEIVDKYTAADQALKTEILGGASASANTLGKLEDLINEATSEAKSYTITAVTGSELTNLGANVNEAYKLVDEDGTKAGDYIKIYKDQTLKSAEYSGQSLVLTYILSDGSESAVSIDMHDLIEETEFGSGVTWDATASKVRGVVDPTSETFLTVGADGFKLAGVQAAIDAASGDVKSKLDELSGKTVTGVEMTGGTAAIAAGDNGTKKITINTDGSQIKATGYAKGTDASAIAATDSINTALAKLENQVDAAKAAATTKVVEGADAGNNLEIVPTTSSTDGSVTYTINLTDVASDSALTAEIAARKAVDGQNGDTYAANTSANYISAATSLNDADVKLDTALKAVADSANSAQTEIDTIETAVGLNADGTHAQSAGNYTSGANSIEGEIVALDTQVKANADAIDALSGKSVTSVTVNGVEVVSNNVAPIVLGYTNEAATSENGMVITTNESTGAMDIKFGTLDCGEYN